MRNFGAGGAVSEPSATSSATRCICCASRSTSPAMRCRAPATFLQLGRALGAVPDEL